MKKCPDCGIKMMRYDYIDRYEDICLKCHHYSIIVKGKLEVLDD